MMRLTDLSAPYKTATTPQPMPDLAEFMTTEEAAEILGFTVASVRQLIYKKKLESMRFGRALLIPRAAVKEYKEKTAGMSKNDPRRNLK
jgi:excisionase family DNA binding protein